MSLQPSSMLAPLTQQMGHLSLGGTATVNPTHTTSTKSSQDKTFYSHVIIFCCVLFQFIPANTPMQGAYIPQYAHIQPAAIATEVRPALQLSGLKHNRGIISVNYFPITPKCFFFMYIYYYISIMGL